MASILNVPEIEFPVEFSQRLNGEDTRTFRLRDNPERENLELTVIDGDTTVFRTIPVYVNNFTAINIAQSDYVYYGWTPGEEEPPVTQENLFNDVVEIRAIKK